MYCPIELLTADGYDMQFGTNVLGLSVKCSKSRLILNHE